MGERGKKLTLEDYRKGLLDLSLPDLELLQKALAEYLQSCAHLSAAQRSLLELDGLGGEIWRGMDAQDYVNHERDSWTS